jgi:hypothetical protein
MTGTIDRARAEAEAMAIAQARAAEASQPEQSTGERIGRAIMGNTVYENVIGGGEADTPGERLGQTINDMGQAFFPGVARGAAEMAGIPGTVSDLMDIPLRRMGLLPDVEGLPSGSPLSGQALREYMSGATNGATEFRGDTTAGRYAGTFGEFLPGATGAGLRGILGYAAIPSVASETAGQLTEGTAAEPYARVAAGLLGSVLGGGMTGATSPQPRPVGSNAETQRLAAYLQSQGVQPTAGQVSGSPMLRRMEGTITPRPAQVEQVTQAAMASIGSQAARATPDALSDAAARIGQTMDDALSGVSIVPTSQMAQAAEDVAENYLTMVPSASRVPRISGMVEEIVDAATSPSTSPIDLSLLRVWRTDLGRMLRSNDEATRTAAQQLRELIDSATDTALTAAGREADLASLATAREQWRNYLAVRDASTRVGSEGGVLSPTQLNQSLIRVFGRDNYAVGRGTDLMETSRAAGELLRPLPTVEAGGIRRLPYVGEAGTAAAGAYAGSTMAGIPGAIAGGLLGAAVPPLGQAAIRSRAVQSLLMDPTLSAAVASRAAPGLLAGN